jgi:hypothetical protein
MKIIKILLISTVVFALLVLGVSFLLPSHVKISRARTIQKPKTVLYTQLSSPQGWQQWHPILKQDSVKAKTLIDSVNRTLSYNQFQVNLKPTTDSTVVIEMLHKGKSRFISTANLIAFGDSTAVNWYTETNLKWYPWEKFKSLFFEQIYGNVLDSNLYYLKQYNHR